MNADFASASAYLKQLAAYVKRPIQWAFLLGLLKTVAVIGQLSFLALLAERLFVSGHSLWSQPMLLSGLSLTSLLRATLPQIQQQFLRRATLLASQQARQKLADDWQRKVLAGKPLAAADGSLQLEPIESLKGYFSRYLVQQYLVVTSPLLILLVCFYLNPVVGALLLISGPIIPVFMALVGIGAERLSQKHAQQTFALSRVFTDKLRNLTTLKLFGAGTAAVNDVAVAGEDYRKATMSTLRIAFLSSAVLEFFSSVAIAGVALYVGFGLLGYIDWLGADQLTLFTGLFVLLLAPEYFAPLRQFAQSYHDRAAAVGAATLLCELNKDSLTAEESSGTSDDLRKDTHLYAWNNLSVTFGSSGANKQLKFPDSEIARGELCVITGDSGSGKTTLVKVLLGQLPFQGQLSQPVESTHQIAYFAQQPFLTAGSLRANLNIFEHHSDAQIFEALAQVRLDKLLATLPEGLGTKLSEHGIGLSGGEQRRLALARCLLSQRAVIIADEPTENLDEVSAEAIRKCLQSYAHDGNTVIVASHDPLLIKRATQLIKVSA
ncbi:ABC transporter ATP-binding protein/permease [Idiomarina sp. UBA4520]|jgi:ATP-binding cassette subfamily C protein CydD|uniref:ABC transporter ATP-binding protein/permease n=1 Tax=Idiomarina sp. UBA4520 TaxID=1946647 RepID=UPI000AED8E15|nr:ATP-binding cassette domain-containing protein [Idiomarina sp. UBA4520]MBF37727.1 ABC transporter ATP-binding protein [Idiomarinaceae bacterium]|tara:strand:- start:16423 stop:18069 length:1647 start_codon:yes stop_codon:yes gene_type:complete